MRGEAHFRESHAVKGEWRVACALLLIFLVACSSPSATATQTPTITKPTNTPTATNPPRPTHVTICEEVVWDIGEVGAWIDEDNDGEWDSAELPLQGVQFWVDDTSHNVAKVTEAVSNPGGLAHLYVERVYCGAAPTEVFDFEVYAEAPAGFQHTTPERLDEEPFRFGFSYIDSPTPEPTVSPSPTHTPLTTPTPTATPAALVLPDLLRPVAAIEDVAPGTFSRLYPLPDGALWLITDQAVAKLVDSTWTVYLSHFTGELASIDAVERVWVVSEDTSAISAWDGSSWTAYAAGEGWTALDDDAYRYAGGARSDGSGRFWLPTAQDVRLFDGASWTVFTPQDMGMGEPPCEDCVPSFGVTVLKGSGEIWVAECEWSGPGPIGGRGVRWFDGQTWQGADSPVASGCATVIEEDSSGNVWLGVEAELWRYDPGAGDWTRFTPADEPPFGALRYGVVIDCVLDPFDEPWVTLRLCYGASCDTDVLYHLRDGVWTQITQDPGYVVHNRLVFDATGTPWLFWQGGVYRVTGDVPQSLVDLFAQSVVVDASGQVWFVARYEGRDVLWTLDAASVEVRPPWSLATRIGLEGLPYQEEP